MNLECQSIKARHRSTVVGTLFVICVVLIIYTFSFNSEKSQPAALITNLDPDTILISLDKASAQQGLQQLRRKMADNPKDTKTVAKYTKRALKIYKLTGDTRYYGYARGALQAWWDNPSPPKDIWLLKARLLQSNHEFQKAIIDLELLLQAYPKNLEAKLLLADALKRVGHINKAKRTCLNIALSNNISWGQLCSIELQLSKGNYQMALDNIKPFLPSSNRDIGVWVLSIAAEAAHASNDLELARKYYKQLVASNRDIVSLVHYADVLISAHAYDEALKILPATSSSLPVLLRIAIAKKQSGIDAQKVMFKLTQRLQDPLLGDNQFLYERTLYALYLQDDVNTALALAQQHWSTQKAWEDSELLITAAQKVSAVMGKRMQNEIAVWRSQW